MSHTTSTFVKDCCSLLELVECLEDLVGHKLEQEDDGKESRFQARVWGINIALYNNHGLEDDVGISFSDYLYEIDFFRYAGSPEVDYETEMCRLMALTFASVVCRKFNCECLVIDNLQHVIKTFSPG